MNAPGGVDLAGGEVAVVVDLLGLDEVILQRVGEIIWVNEVVASVVRRVDIDQFHFAEVRLKQQLQHFEVVAFDKGIAGRVEVH